MTTDVMGSRESRFATYHPVVNFLFFVVAIVCSVIFLHPYYLVLSVLCAFLLLLTVRGGRAFRTVLILLPLAVVVAVINPLFNIRGQTVLFTIGTRPYTLEALVYGIAIALMLMAVLLWFSCYNAIMTSDKFTSLFGNVIPALSLVLVMILRLVPIFEKKAKQFSGARRCIGKGATQDAPLKSRLQSSLCLLSALTGWALEGSVETADSMRSRGYGTARRRTFAIYHKTGADWIVLILICVLALVVIGGALFGFTTVSYTPVICFAPLTPAGAVSLFAYGILLLIPSWINLWEVIKWNFYLSKI